MEDSIVYVGLLDKNGKEVEYDGYSRQRVRLTKPYVANDCLKISNASEVAFPMVPINGSFLPFFKLNPIVVTELFLSTDSNGGAVLKKGMLAVQTIMDEGSIAYIGVGSMEIKIL